MCLGLAEHSDPFHHSSLPWPHLHTPTLPHFQVFCQKAQPNCSACPLAHQCDYARCKGPRLQTTTATPSSQPTQQPQQQQQQVAPAVASRSIIVTPADATTASLAVVGGTPTPGLSSAPSDLSEGLKDSYNKLLKGIQGSSSPPEGSSMPDGTSDKNPAIMDVPNDSLGQVKVIRRPSEYVGLHQSPLPTPAEGPQQPRALPTFVDLTADSSSVHHLLDKTHKIGHRRLREPAGSKQLGHLCAMMQYLDSVSPKKVLEGVNSAPEGSKAPEGVGAARGARRGKMTRGKNKAKANAQMTGEGNELELEGKLEAADGKRKAEAIEIRFMQMPIKRQRLRSMLPGPWNSEVDNKARRSVLNGRPSSPGLANRYPAAASLAGMKRSAAVMAKWLTGSRPAASPAADDDACGKPPGDNNDKNTVILIADDIDDDVACLSETPTSPATNVTPQPFSPSMIVTPPQIIGRRTRSSSATITHITSAAEEAALLPHRVALQDPKVPLDLGLSPLDVTPTKASTPIEEVQQAAPPCSSPEPLVTPRAGGRRSRLRARTTLDSPPPPPTSPRHNRRESISQIDAVVKQSEMPVLAGDSSQPPPQSEITSQSDPPPSRRATRGSARRSLLNDLQQAATAAPPMSMADAMVQTPLEGLSPDDVGVICDGSSGSGEDIGGSPAVSASLDAKDKPDTEQDPVERVLQIVKVRSMTRVYETWQPYIHACII